MQSCVCHATKTTGRISKWISAAERFVYVSKVHPMSKQGLRLQVHENGVFARAHLISTPHNVAPETGTCGSKNVENYAKTIAACFLHRAGSSGCTFSGPHLCLSHLMLISAAIS